MAAMVGALTLARAVGDDALSDEILDAVQPGVARGRGRKLSRPRVPQRLFPKCS